MKKILIGVVVVLLIAGVIGGSFAIANHFKKPEVTPDEKPVEQEKVFQNAVLTDGAKVDKIYINPDYTFNEADAEIFAGNKFFLMINENEFIDVDDKQSLFVTGSGNPLNNTLNYATMEYNHYEDMMGFYIGHTVGLSKPINNGAMIYTVQGTLSDINVVYNAEEKSLDLSKLNYTLIINKERVNELKKIDFISLEPFYVTNNGVNGNDNANGNDTVVENVKTSANSVLSTQQTINKLYINPNFDYNKYATECDNDSTLVMGTPIGIFVKKGLENTTYTNEQLSEIFATEQSAEQFVNSNCNGDEKTISVSYCGMAKGAIAISLKDGEWNNSVMFRDKSIDVSNGSSNSFSKKAVIIENGVISLGQDYILILNPKYLKAVVNSNCISTVPYPAVA